MKDKAIDPLTELLRHGARDLRDIDACLNAQRSKLHHLEICSVMARNTLEDVNTARVRAWRGDRL